MHVLCHSIANSATTLRSVAASCDSNKIVRWMLKHVKQKVEVHRPVFSGMARRISNQKPTSYSVSVNGDFALNNNEELVVR